MPKTILIHLDGIPNSPWEDLGNRTILQAAKKPYLDELAKKGELGRLGIAGESRRLNGEMVLLGLLGYDTPKVYTGPGPFEGINLEVVLDKHDVAYLCHFVTLRGTEGWGDGKKLGSQLFMDDPHGDGLETEEARELIDTLNDQLVSENIQFYMGHGYRHLMVWAGGQLKSGCGNPLEAVGQSIEPYLPTGSGGDILRELMEASRVILRHHPVNQDRIHAGYKPANCVWLWGPGKPVELPKLQEKSAIKGTIVSTQGPYVGIGISAGLKTVHFPSGGNGNVEELQKMAEIGAKILETQDFGCLHVPFSDWVGPDGPSTSLSQLVEYVQGVDEHVVGPLMKVADQAPDRSVLVVNTAGGHQQEGDKPLSAFYALMVGRDAEGATGQSGTFDEGWVSQLPVRNAMNLCERLILGS